MARNVTAIAISTMLARGIQLAWSILLAQLLGEAGFGVWGTIGGMITIAATLPEFGMGLVVLRDVARRPALSGKYLSATLTVQPLLALLAYALLVGAGLLLPYDTQTRLLLGIAALSLIIDTLGNMGHNQLLAAEQMVTTSAILIVHILLLIGFVFPVLLRGGGLPGLYLATIAAGIFRVGLYWLAMRRQGIRPEWPVEVRLIRRLFVEGLPLAVSAFFSLAYQHIDKVLVFTLLSKADAGNLVTAFIVIFGVVELLSTTVVTALYPLMSRLAHEQPDAARAVARQIAFLMLVIALPIGVGISGLASPLAALLFPRFQATAAVLEVLIWHAVLMMVGSPYDQLLIVQNRQGRMLMIRVSGLILNIAMNFILLPRLGVQGAGVAILISQSVVLALLLHAHRTDAGALRALAGRAARACLAGALMALCVVALRQLSPLLAGIVGMAVYGGAVLALRALGAEHWAIVKKAAHAMPIVGPLFGRLLSSGGQQAPP